MSKEELCKRYSLFILGLFVSAFGVSLITKAQLGTAPISSVPYTLSMGFPITMGTLIFLLNMLMIIGQLLLLKRKFQLVQLIQVPVSIMFGYFIDLTMSLLSFLNPATYLLKIEFLLAGCVILALGISMEVIANVVMLSGEAFVQAISVTFNKEFGRTKVVFDVTLIAAASIISVFLFGELVGIGEGTMISALIVGLIVRFFNGKLRFVNDRLRTEQNGEVSETI